jgi:hypothetical protein
LFSLTLLMFSLMERRSRLLRNLPSVPMFPSCRWSDKHVRQIGSTNTFASQFAKSVVSEFRDVRTKGVGGGDLPAPHPRHP